MFKASIGFAAISACLVTLAISKAQATPEYDACIARAHHKVVQEGICGQREVAVQDARLNKAYQQLMHQLAATPERKIALRDEQRRWLKKRDYDCQVDKDTTDDSCLIDRTASRADELEHQLKF